MKYYSKKIKSTMTMHGGTLCKSITLLFFAVIGLLLFIRPVSAMTESVLYSFTGPPGGANPYAGLVMDTKGNLYGTTRYGGNGDYGTVFKLDPSNTLTVLHSFIRTDGINPDAALVMDTKGNLYGTTISGGDNYYGTVFKLDPTNNTLTVLHSFIRTDGINPDAALVMDTKGNLYGTTVYGGDNDYGTVFKLDPSNTLTVLHSFTGSDGAYPYAGLVMDKSGNLYGTTTDGGDNNYGTVFKLSTSGKQPKLTVLHSFTGSDGVAPYAGLVRDTKGNLYGTTFTGGDNNYGTVFKLSTSGKQPKLTVLHSFTWSDGVGAYAALIMDTNGNLYGTTISGGGDNGYGTVFKLDPSNTLTVLHSFTGSDGANPYTALIMDTNGNLYGTTYGGGDNDYGTVFKLAPITP